MLGFGDNFKQRIKLLKRFNLSSTLETHFAEHMDGRIWKEGEVVTREGDVGDSMFFLHSGHLKVFKKGDDDQDVEIAEMKSGDFFGEIALLKGNPRTSTVIVDKESFIYELRWKDIKFLINSNHQLEQQLHTALMIRVENDEKQLNNMG